MRGQVGAHPIHQNLGAAAGYGAKTGGNETLHNFGNGQMKGFGKKHDLRRRKAMHLQSGAPDEADQFLVIGQRQVRIEAALQ